MSTELQRLASEMGRYDALRARLAEEYAADPAATEVTRDELERIDGERVRVEAAILTLDGAMDAYRRALRVGRR